MKEAAIRTLKITSSAFNNNDNIPANYTCEGENINPPLKIDKLPDGTVSIAIIVEDQDSSNGDFTHWIVWNIPPKTIIEENSFTGGVEGLNDFGKHNYMGPCPPSGSHRYYFKIYALNSMLHLESHSQKDALEVAIPGHVLGQGELIGLYQKKRNKIINKNISD